VQLGRHNLVVLLTIALLWCGWSTVRAEEIQTPAASSLPYQLEWGVKIPMRDDVTLNATVYHPAKQTGRLPVIMTLTPYVSDRFHDVGAFFAQHGYVFAIVDSRGRGNSDGVFEPWVNEGRDGFDAVEWLAHQPYADGQVAMWGGSYGGKNQWAVASLAPPSLKTIVPASAGYVGYDFPMRRNIPTPSMLQYLALLSGRTSNWNLSNWDLSDDQSFWNAALEELSRGAVSFRAFEQITGFANPNWKRWVDHPEPDGFWDAANPSAKALGAIEIPVLTITATYDDAQTGALEFRRLHLAGASAEAASRNYTIIGPWDHAGTRKPSRALGGLDFGPQSVLDVISLHVAWYDWVMKNGRKPDILQGRFVYYVTGANRWVAAADLPAWREDVLFLSSRNTSGDSLQRRGELSPRTLPQRPDFYRYDPSAPARNEGVEARSVVSKNFLTDPRSFAVLDGDGLIYDSSAFNHKVQLVGRPRARLYLSMDVPDTDIRVQLFEVHKNGSVVFLGQDQIRARYRNDPRHAELVTIGKTEEYVFDQFPFIARQIDRGSRLRLVISPLGMSIHQQRNRNSGGIVADETAKDNRGAIVSVVLGPNRSRLYAPIVGAANGQSARR
jgi:putative CocE/NonD family hydrolase